jgi:hypothetical protein
VDPVSVGLLVALAGGAGGEMGRQVWAGLSALVRRPLQPRQQEGAPAVSSGRAELAALEEAPEDSARADALRVALAERSGVDAEFRSELEQWAQQARRLRVDTGEVHNSISGGRQNGPVFQGRDFSNLSFSTPGPSSKPPPSQTTSPE